MLSSRHYRAVGNENCCQPQMKWLFEQNRKDNQGFTKVGLRNWL